MSSFLVLTVLFIHIYGHYEKANSLEDRIVSGLLAVPGQFPYQISLRRSNNGQHICGGSIITNRFIVTAAHCIYRKHANDFYIVAGTNNLHSGGEIYRIVFGTYHANYNPSRLLHDIALLKVDRDIQFHPFVQPINLETREVLPESSFILSGWGLTGYPGNSPVNLQYVELRMFSTQQCTRLLFPQVITNYQICTFTRYGQGACFGDSGGPLVSNAKLVGVVSSGRPCARGYPDVFTKIAAYYGWIQYNMK